VSPANRSWPWVEVWFSLLLSAAGLATLGALAQRGWPGTPVDCTATLCFCEATSDGLWRQPANTWSNLGPLLISLAVAVDAGRRRLKATAPSPALTLLGFAFPAMLVFQGLGAMFFHASLMGWAGAIDASSMFTIVGLLLSINLLRAGVVTRGRMIGVWLALVVVGLGLGWISPEVVSPVMFLLVISVLGSEVWLARHGLTPSATWFRVGIWVFLAGVAVWFGSAIEGAPLCWVDSLWQGHALWHVTSAVAVGLFWVHVRKNLEPSA